MAEIRPARPEEFSTLLSLVRALAEFEGLTPPDEAAAQRLERDLFGPKPRLEAWMAFSGGQAAGYALVLETYSSFLALPTLYLEDIFVLPDFRGQRVGSAIFRRLVREARQRGCGRMEWVVLDWNTSAQRFYRSYGAQPLSNWQTWRLEARDFDTVTGDE